MGPRQGSGSVRVPALKTVLGSGLFWMVAGVGVVGAVVLGLRGTTHYGVTYLVATTYPKRTERLTPQRRRERNIARKLKSRNPAAIAAAAVAMAPLIDDNAVLVPLPSSSGSTAANETLARAIAELAPGAQVADILGRRAPVESSTERRRRNRRGLRPEEHLVELRSAVPDGSIYFVDNVVTTGATAEAGHQVVGRGIVLAYAKAAGR
jgi:hypothetical protein